ncbi:MAG: hypothetical protein IPK83_10530 [Planctomycetes bacterium]|nr:hypothetical protein [Planctomycetota bacterium]
MTSRDLRFAATIPSRDRCTAIDKDGADQASYRYVGCLLGRRDGNSEYAHALTPVTHHPAFKTEILRDNIH